MAMDGDVLAVIDELARQKRRLCGPKSVRHTFPRFALRARSLELRTSMTVSDAEKRSWDLRSSANSGTTRLGRQNIPVDKSHETEVKVIIRNITQYHSHFDVRVERFLDANLGGLSCPFFFTPDKLSWRCFFC
jgi:hypothetical protein